MTRTAIYYGIWTVLCMVTTIVAFYVAADLIDGEKNFLNSDNPSWSAIGFLAAFSPIAGIVAALIWAFFHRDGRHPRWWIYVLIALLVIAFSHMLVFGLIGAWESQDLLRDLIGGAIMFMIHGWLSVPVAFLGTALFVLWKRRRGWA